MASYEYGFDPDDRNNTAASVYRMARAGGKRVLDLGSGPGIVAARLANDDGKEVVCIDVSPAALTAAAERGLTRTIEADLADPAWANEVAGEAFDVIVLADVLEHLVEPRSLLELIEERGVLAKGGTLVISVPNAGHEAVLAELIKGRFTYQDTGLLDSTHLRFFTLASLREMLERAGFFITQIERTRRTAEQTTLAVHDVALPPELRDRVLEAAPEAQTYQFIVTATRADAARDVAELLDRLEVAEAKLTEQERVAVRDDSAKARQLAEERAVAAETAARAERAAMQGRIDELEHALRRERRLTASERKRYEQALAQAKGGGGGGEAAKREIARLEKKLDDVYQSRTWKVGRAAWTAFHAPSRLLRKAKPQQTTVAAPSTAQPVPIADPVDYALVENVVVRQKYESAVARRMFSGSARNVAIAVSTDGLDEGRGDLYTAIGLGRHLEEIGYEVIYLPHDRWYDVPTDTEIYVAMLETVDITRLPMELATVAWVRNQTAAWAEQPWLALYDMVLASSQQSLDVLARSYPGRLGLLPVGVDTELFSIQDQAKARAGVVSTVNQWGREREVFAYLKEKVPDFPLALYGQQRGIAPELRPYACGPVSFFSLPSLYSQARVVLDDFNHTTAGFGNVNSRVFEAAVCGAVVMTNRSTGLESIGLGNVAVFSSARQLFDLIDEALVMPGALDTADQLRNKVLERHSYKQRAAEFDAHLGSLSESPQASEGVVVSYYPDYRDNPYTEMMWSELRRKRGIAIPVGNDLNFTATMRASEHRPTVFHLNWTAPILGGATDDHDRLVRHRRFLEAIDEMHANGIPSIWTIHNVLPHECADREMEAQLRQEIADRVDIIHVMCEETVAACADWYELPRSKVRVIPHPSYVDVYPNLVDRDTARRELELRSEDFVYLHFGQIRPYKGVDRLLDSFEQLGQRDRDARLLLVGSLGRFEGVRQLTDRARANPNVIGNFNPVPDDDVQLYMNAADVVVLPHRQALNSGALLLAYSFARPVVAPATGCIAQMVDETTGVSFAADGGSTALLNAMMEARQLGARHEEAAYARAKELHYLGSGKRFSAILDELLENRSRYV